MTPILAAGFIEVTDTPQAFFTALIVSIAYLCFISLPVFRLRRAPAEERKGLAGVLVLTLVLPLLVREVAVLIQGPSWRDWHFIWLYLIASTLLLGASYSIAGLWRFAGKKAHPAGTDNSGAARLRV